MYLWQKTASRRWLASHEALLQTNAREQLVIVRRPGRRRLRLEVACRWSALPQALAKKFGGRVEKLPRGWLRRFSNDAKNEPIRVGTRLIIANAVRGKSAAASTASQLLVIPAGAAFGTGQHVTTAMILRALEQMTRTWKNGWSLIDLGTGSGILALAAKRLGAGRAAGIDNDPAAISTAKSNAQLNRIGGVVFKAGDVRHWRTTRAVDIITANLYSDLLLEILPKLKRGRWVILSGVLRSQAKEIMAAMRRNQMAIAKVKRRGKWILIVARRARRHEANTARPAR